MNRLENKSSDEIRELVEDALRKVYFGENWQVSELAWTIWIRRLYPFGNRVVYAYEEKDLQRSFMIDPETLVVTIEDDEVEVEREETWVPVEMSFSKEEEEYVERTGTIFESGDYPDKQVSFTDDDLSVIAQNSQKAPLMIEHNPNPVLDQLLRKFGLIWSKVEGSKLVGCVRIPKWLDEAFTKEGIPFKVSVGFDSTLRRIREISLCKWPRIDNAELFVKELAAIHAQFTTSNTPPQQEEPSPPKPNPPTFGNPPETMNLEALKLLFTKSDPATLRELGLSADQIDKLEVKTPKTEISPQFVAMQNGFVETKAEQFFATLTVPDDKGVVHATAAMKEPILTLFRAALQADGEAGEIKFSTDRGIPVEGDNVKALRDLMKEFGGISTGQVIPAFNQKGPDGNLVDPMAVTKDSVKGALGVK